MIKDVTNFKIIINQFKNLYKLLFLNPFSLPTYDTDSVTAKLTQE